MVYTVLATAGNTGCVQTATQKVTTFRFPNQSFQVKSCVFNGLEVGQVSDSLLYYPAPNNILGTPSEPGISYRWRVLEVKPADPTKPISGMPTANQVLNWLSDTTASAPTLRSKVTMEGRADKGYLFTYVRYSYNTANPACARSDTAFLSYCDVGNGGCDLTLGNVATIGCGGPDNKIGPSKVTIGSGDFYWTRKDGQPLNNELFEIGTNLPLNNNGPHPFQVIGNPSGVVPVDYVLTLLKSVRTGRSSDTCRVDIKVFPGAVSKPNVNYASSQAVCEGQVYTVQGPAGQPALTYSWSPLSILNSPADSSKALPTLKGLSNNTAAYVTVTDPATGCAVSDTVNFDVTPVQVEAGSNASFCKDGTTLDIGSLNPISGYTYQWTAKPATGVTFGDATKPKTTVTLPATTSGGKITLYLTAVNGLTAANCALTDSVVMTSAAALTFTLPTTPALCSTGGKVEIGPVSPSGTGDTYVWTGPGIVSGQGTNKIIANVVGAYQVTVTQQACTGTASRTIVAATNPTVNLAPAAACANDVQIGATTMTATQKSGWDFSWDKYDALKSNAGDLSTITVRPLVTTTYTLTAKHISGCTQTFPVVVQAAAYSASLPSTLNFCEGQTAILSLNDPTSVGGTVVWTSTPANAISYLSSATAINPSIDLSLAAAGSYTYTATVSYGTGCVSRASVKVNIGKKIESIAGFDREICVGTCTTLGIPIITGMSYTWSASPADASLTVINGPRPLVCPSTSTTYNLSYIDAAGCKFTDDVFVKVNPSPVLTVNSVIKACQNLAGTATVNLATAILTNTGTTTTYWQNASATVASTNTVNYRGTFYVKTENTSGCFVIKPVTVTFNDLPTATVTPLFDCTTQKGSLQIATSTTGLRYDYTTSTTYTGNKTFANASVLSTITLINNLSALTSVGQDYTVRIFGADSVCYQDYTVKIVNNCPKGSIGDYVWTDQNNNGQQDGTEAPIAGVKVYLLNASGVKIDSTITNTTGKYLFDSLLTGSYKVQFVAPVGTIAAKQNTGADVSDSDANKAGLSQLINIDTTKLPTDTLRNNPQIDAGFVPVGSLGDFVFNDRNGNGVQDATDTPIAGIKVYLLNATTGAKLDSALTDAAGKYTFDSLLAGSYKVQFVIPAGSEATGKTLGGDSTKDSNINPDGTTDAITINTTLPVGDVGRNNPTIDAGIKPAYGSIGDYVWTDQNNNSQQDATEAPISGVKVYLLDGTTGAKLDSALTDATGKYLFDSLLTGSYKVQFVAPVGTIAAKQNTGADVSDSDVNKAGLSQLINIDTTKLPTDTLRNNPQIDAGFVPVGSLGDFVFNDRNGNGVQDATDTPTAGIKVYLLNATTGAKLDSTLTDALGKYTFDSLLAGSYKVQFVIPVGSEATGKTLGGDATKDSNINPDGTTEAITINTTLPVGDVGRNNPTIDAGIKPAYGSIGDYVWTDINNDGQQTSGETPIAGVKVYLLNASGVKIDSTITNATGKYLFDSLLTGSYKVQFVAPVGTIPAKQNTGADVSDSDANKAGLSQLINIDTTKLPTDTLRNNPQIDAGFVPVGSLGDFVFNDRNGNGVQDATDTPIAGIKVYLLNATTGAKLDSALTDAAGKYTFDSLLAGSYKVQFVIPVGSEATGKTLGGDATKDSNINPDGTTDAITIDTTLPVGDVGRNNPTIDAGIKPAYGSIGDYVWTDINNDGQQTSGETPIAGVKVYLLNGTTGAKLDSALTDATGKYLFDSLLTGSYKVQFVAPVGTIAAKQNTGADVTDSDVNKAGLSQLINIDTTKLPTDTLRNNPQIDAGFVPVGSLGDFVFNDKNGNGVQDATDTPIAGIKVYLLNATTGAKLDSALTDAAGKYTFDSLLAGSYKVQFVIPAGSEATGKTLGGDSTKDSNINPDGTTDAITINTTLPVGDVGRNNPTIDAGIKPAYGSIGDYVWTDINNDGQQTSGETPISGVKVYLLNGTTGAKLDSALTDATGKYLFDSLLTGSYKVQFVAPAGTIASKQNIGADVTDSDANKLGLSQLINIDTTKLPSDTLRNNLQIDAGFVPVGSIGDYVFADNNSDGVQNTGDTPIPNVKVYLLDGTTGTKLDSTLTDVLGKYTFGNLLTGTYKVQFVKPLSYISFTTSNTSDDTKDSDVNSLGISQLISINTSKLLNDTLRNNPNIDAGLIPSPTKVDLSLKKTVIGNCKRAVGDLITYKILIKREDNEITNVNATVKDSLSASLQFVSATTSNGTYDNTTGLWSGINLSKGDTATLTLIAKIKPSAMGLVCNEAWISFMDKQDVDSQAGNKNETEDDFARVCVSVPITICQVRNESVVIAAPSGYTNYQWYDDTTGQLILGATSQTYNATKGGIYSVKVNGNSCPNNTCCPIYVEDFCECPPNICVPFVIQKTKTRTK